MYLPEDAEIIDLTSDHYGRISKGFEFLFNQLNSISGVEFKGSKNDIDIDRSGDVIDVDSDDLLKIKGVGFKVGGSGGPIDICLTPDIEIIGVELDGNELLVIKKSQTSVCYLKTREWEPDEEDEIDRSRSPASVLSAYHFDFNLDIGDRHPIFHAHFEPSSIKLGTLSRDYHIENENHVTSSFPNHPRVPSAPLDFVGVLFTLIHEHREEATIWPSQFKRPFELLPKFPPWCFAPEPQFGTTMFTEWWYLHKPDGPGISTEILNSRISDSV